MGSMPKLIDAEVEQQASDLMAIDFLCPDNRRRWARLHLAVAHWHRQDPKGNSQGALAKAIKVDARQIRQARHPPKDPAATSNKLADAKHCKAAEVLGVDAEWLVQGYAADGKDVWPLWSQAMTAVGRHTITEVFTDLLDDAIAGKPVPAVIYNIVDWPAPRPLPVLMVGLPDHLGHQGALTVEVRRYLARSDIDVKTYLTRYRTVLQQAWLQMASRAPQELLSPSYRFFGMSPEQHPPHRRNQWIARNWPQPSGGA
ncbi:MAG TPA: hypothetical protein DCS97_04040 [Planctomycetes bacterium]|nr:hypothetical protein [Planctomycetota bacterium]